MDGLGIAHSLGPFGVPVVIADTDPYRPGLHSRYVRAYRLHSLSGPELIEDLLAIHTQIRTRAILFPTTDMQVQAISEHRNRLCAAFRLHLPHPACLVKLMHKAAFQCEAERLGFPIPKAICIRNEEDLAKLKKIRFPAVIKPGDKALFFANKAMRNRKVNSREEAENICREVLPNAPDLITQEWIEGSEHDIYFCLQYRGANGETVCSFVGRKLRCWPPETGSTASCIAAPEVAKPLERMTTAFFNKTCVVGMCSMEFKRDARNGEFFMVEPTIGRTDWQEEIATLNGVNIPLAAYRYEIGLPGPALSLPRRPIPWMYPPSFWRAIVSTRSFRDGWRSIRRAKSAYFNFGDPLPFIYFMFEWARRLFGWRRWRELALGH